MEIWKHFKDIRRVTSEDSDHRPMQGGSNFAGCGDNQACKLQLQISG